MGTPQKVLGCQPTNNRSLEIQLMHRFPKDIRHLQLHYEALSLPLVDHFKVTLPDAPCDVPLVLDTDTTPGPRSVVATLSLDEM